MLQALDLAGLEIPGGQTHGEVALLLLEQRRGQGHPLLGVGVLNESRQDQVQRSGRVAAHLCLELQEPLVQGVVVHKQRDQAEVTQGRRGRHRRVTRLLHPGGEVYGDVGGVVGRRKLRRDLRPRVEAHGQVRQERRVGGLLGHPQPHERAPGAHGHGQLQRGRRRLGLAPGDLLHDGLKVGEVGGVHGEDVQRLHHPQHGHLGAHHVVLALRPRAAEPLEALALALEAHAAPEELNHLGALRLTDVEQADLRHTPARPALGELAAAHQHRQRAVLTFERLEQAAAREPAGV